MRGTEGGRQLVGRPVTSLDMKQWCRDHPTGADAFLGLVLFPIGALTMVYGQRGPTGRSPDALAWISMVGLFATLAWRRRHPTVVAYLGAMFTAVIWVRNYTDGATVIAGSIITFGIARYLARRQAIRVIAVVVACLGAVGAWSANEFPGNGGWWQFFGRMATIAAAFFIGDAVRSRHTVVSALQERAERAEHEREAQAQRAVAEERTRIARDLHDVVAHSLSVMVIQATAAKRLVAVDALRSEAALDEVIETGRAALGEMRSIVGVLADGEHAEYRPQARLVDVTDLLDRIRSSGVAITYSCNARTDDLSAAVEVAAYRVIQESLTNVLKHAGPARVSVAVERNDSNLTVSVSDTGRGVVTSLARSGGDGRGLIGMRERVEAVGGTLTTGPGVGGGFAVIAVLPASHIVAPARESSVTA
jgi:signal transduction histidine kinase